MGFLPSVYFWLVVLISCLVIEAITPQLVSIWFAVGAIGALIVARLNFGMIAQIAVFLILSLALLLLLRPILRNILRLKQTKTNADRILEQTAVVTQTIDNQQETGQIRLMGQTWTARNIHENEIIAQGETVIVRRISGVKAMVERSK